MDKPETRFIQTIHRRLQKLEPAPFIWKINDRFKRGIVDALYIGPSGCLLWVEYKVHPNKPTKLQQYYMEKLTMLKQHTAIVTQYEALSKIETPTETLLTANPWEWIATQLGYTGTPYAATQTRTTQRR